MPRSVLERAVAVAALLTVAVTLTGCAPHPSASTTPSPTGRAANTPTPTPTPTLPPLAADVLFQISVVATAPGGATAHLTETVHAPVTATTTQAADETLLDTECDSWRNAFTNTKFLVAQVTTTVTAGTWNSGNLISADMAGYPVWTGDQRPFQAYCASALPSIPGSTRAVSPVGGASPDTNGGWGIYRYGFAIPTDPSAGASPAATDVVLSKCTIQLGSAASGSVFAGTWPSTVQTDNGLSCFFGGT
ncbi:MAG: hypothetical protein M3N46_00605 [Actinomycetota bacterium]|nr:hypothetical protein [Actinomycetota bacterium]